MNSHKLLHICLKHTLQGVHDLRKAENWKPLRAARSAEAELASMQHLRWSFLWQWLAPSSYCSKELYLRCCMDARPSYEVDDQLFFFGLEILFSKNSHHIVVTSRLICFANQLTGFYMIRVFTDSRFRADYKYKQINSVTVISDAVIQRLSQIIQKNSQIIFSPMSGKLWPFLMDVFVGIFQNFFSFWESTDLQKYDLFLTLKKRYIRSKLTNWNKERKKRIYQMEVIV